MHSQDEGRDDKKPRRVVDVGCLSGLQLRNMPGNGSVSRSPREIKRRNDAGAVRATGISGKVELGTR